MRLAYLTVEEGASDSLLLLDEIIALVAAGSGGIQIVGERENAGDASG